MEGLERGNASPQVARLSGILLVKAVEDLTQLAKHGAIFIA